MLRRPLLPLTALIWGLQFSFLNPSLALILVARYQATPAEVGWTLAIYNGACFAVSLIVPALADRKRQYLWPLLLASALTVVLVGALALVTSLPWATIALICFGAPAGVGVSLIFALVATGGADTAEMMNIRAIYSFAWVVGPPICTALIAGFGNLAALLAVGGFGLCSVATALIMIGRPAGASAGPAPNPRPVAAPPSRGRLTVAVLIAAFVLIHAANVVTVAVLSLFVTAGLGLPVVWAGVALGLAAGLEIPGLVALGRLGERHAFSLLIGLGVLAGLGYVLGLMVVSQPWHLLALQPLNAVFVAVTSGLGLALFQRMISGPGLAAGTFGNTNRVGTILAGPVIALAGSPWGYAAVFLACAVLLLVGGVAAVWASRTQPDPIPAGLR